MEWTVFLEVLESLPLSAGVRFFVAGHYAMAMLSAVVAASLVGYLLHNFHPASILWGIGSLIIGFLLAVQAIQFVGLNEIPAFVEVFGSVSSVMPSNFNDPSLRYITSFYSTCKAW